MEVTMKLPGGGGSLSKTRSCTPALPNDLPKFEKDHQDYCGHDGELDALIDRLVSVVRLAEEFWDRVRGGRLVKPPFAVHEHLSIKKDFENFALKVGNGKSVFPPELDLLLRLVALLVGFLFRDVAQADSDEIECRYLSHSPKHLADGVLFLEE